MNEQVENLEPSNVFSPREFILKYLKYVPWLVISVFLFLALAFITLRYSIPVYEVKAKLLIKRDNNFGKQDKLENLFMMNESQNLVDEIEILKSTTLSRRIIQAIGLETSYYNVGKVRSQQLHPIDAPFHLEILQLKDSTKQLAFELTFINESRFHLSESSQPYYFGQTIENGAGKFRFARSSISHRLFASKVFRVTWHPIDMIAGSLAASFKINPIVDYSNVLLIKQEIENPKIGKDIVNQLMQEYNIASVEDKRKITVYTLQFIDERLDTLRLELGGVEQGLQNFQEKNKAIELKEQSIISFNELSDVNKMLTEQEVKLNIVNYLQNYLSDDRNINKTVPVQLGIEEPSLVSLIQQYNSAQLKRENLITTTPAANQIIRDLDTEIQKLRQQIKESLSNIRQAYIISRDNLAHKSRLAETDISAVPGKAKRLLEITRQQKILEELYSFLLRKKLETSITSASTISNSKVVETAQSSSVPVKPDRKSSYILAMIAGLILPVGIIFLKEYLNDRITSRSDVVKSTKAPILGEIGHSIDKNTLVITKDNRSFIAEQFRILRTNLQYITNKIERPVILVTSSFSGEGKSFISTNMGAVMAVAGKKTVILEFDLRKPKIIAGLDLARSQGITNYIVGNLTIKDITFPVQQVENLFIIPCGPIPPNPAELLLDEKIKELFHKLREQFDVVIVDSAPVGLVSDAVILSEYADATLYILRQQYTLKKHIGIINDIYENKKLPKVSRILNDVKASSSSYSNYGGYGYGYGYGSSYFEEPKKKTGLADRVKGWFT